MTVNISAAAWRSCREVIMTMWITACAARNPAPASAAGQYAGRQARGAKRETSHQESRADVFDEVRIKGAGIGHARNAHPPGGTGKQHREPIRHVKRRQDSCDPSLHGYLLRPRRAGEVRRDGIFFR